MYTVKPDCGLHINSTILKKKVKQKLLSTFLKLTERILTRNPRAISLCIWEVYFFLKKKNCHYVLSFEVQKSHEALKHTVLIITNGRFNIKFAKKKVKNSTEK